MSDVNYLNNAKINSQLHGHHEKLLGVVLWKLGYRGDKRLHITLQDLIDFNLAEQTGGDCVLFQHGHKDSIEFGMVSLAKAEQIAKLVGGMTEGSA